MRPVDRRNVLGLALVAAVTPLLASRNVLAAEVGSRIAPPTGPMMYRRAVERHLQDGATFSVSRSFSIRFILQEAGYAVEGEQLSVDVKAPDSLARFAELETQRVETGVFPLELDFAGRIVEGAVADFTAEVEAAVEATHARLDADEPGSANHAEMEQLVEAIHRAGAGLTTHLPRDIFAPVETARRDKREIRLPWGAPGEVTTIFTAECDPQTRLMRHASREVVTDLGGDIRRNIERWELHRA